MKKSVFLGLSLAAMILAQTGCSGGSSGPGRTTEELTKALVGNSFTIEAASAVLSDISSQTGGSVSISSGDTAVFASGTLTVSRGGSAYMTATWSVQDGDTIRVTHRGRSADLDIALQGSTLVVSKMTAVSGSTGGNFSDPVTPPAQQTYAASDVLPGQSFTLAEVNIDGTTHTNATVSFTEERFTVKDGGAVILGGSWTDLGGGVIEVNAYNIGDGFCVPLGSTTSGSVSAPVPGTLASTRKIAGGGDAAPTSTGMDSEPPSGVPRTSAEGGCDGILVISIVEGPDPMP